MNEELILGMIDYFIDKRYTMKDSIAKVAQALELPIEVIRDVMHNGGNDGSGMDPTAVNNKFSVDPVSDDFENVVDDGFQDAVELVYSLVKYDGYDVESAAEEVAAEYNYIMEDLVDAYYDRPEYSTPEELSTPPNYGI